MILRILQILALALAWIVAIISALWSVGAFYFDFPLVSYRPVAATLLTVGFIVILILLKKSWRKLLAIFAVFLLVVAWWLTLRPSNDRSWQPEVAQTAWAEIQGDEVTLHNVRNFDYRSVTDFTPHWETRTIRLSQLTGVDLAINYWGSSLMAHPIVSFQFADAPAVCFSIETRMEIGESYSAIGGLYRRYELIYVVSDERDVIRVRTNFRKGEDIYLYHTNITPELARNNFLEYINRLNRLHEEPAWYNAVTANCTTSIRTQRSASERTPWDWRMLVNGFGDEMLYERGALDQSLPFAELKNRAHINERAKVANDSPDFSKRIREYPVPAR